ncbi:MAG: AAA family ATPase [Myxococcales bacterium]|nr:AAA family ATPase [Myxococcales bacterium]
MIFRFQNCELDLGRRELRRGGRAVRVHPKVLAILEQLLQRHGTAVSDRELLEAVWPGTSAGREMLQRALHEVRRAIGDRDGEPPLIETVPRLGHRFVAPIERVPDTPVAIPTQPAFVGRQDSLDLLRASLADALGGRGSLVLLDGDPGIGKTRLAEELADHARASGARVLVGRCAEVENPPAFDPWVQIVKAYLHGLDRQAAEAALGAEAARIAQAVPEIRQTFSDLGPTREEDPNEARFQLFDAITQFLVRAAAKQPLLLLLDDLHHAGYASLRLLDFLTERLRNAPILVIATCLDAELRQDLPRAAILGSLFRDERSLRLRLEGLSHPDISKLLHAISGRPPTDGLVAALHEQTGGNPFFLVEIVELLRVRGRLDSLEGLDLVKFPIPKGVREAVRRHLDTLSPGCQQLLEIASVFGREFSAEALSKVAAREPAAVIKLLAEARSVHVALESPDPGERYRFNHSLTRETLYTGLGAAERIQLHARVGNALAELGGQDQSSVVAELAHHFTQAAPAGGTERAIEYSVRAAEQAQAQLAWEAAVAHYQRALQTLDLGTADEELRCRLLLQLGDSQWATGQGEAARDTLLRASVIARSLGQADLFARATLATGLWDVDELVDHTLVKLLQEALQALPKEDSALRARVLGRLAREIRSAAPWERLRELSNEAVEMARRVDDPSALADVLVARHLSLWGPENTEDRFATAVEIVRLAEQIDAKGLALQGRQFRLADLLELGDVTGVDLELDAIAWMASQLRLPQHLWFTSLLRAMRAHLSGRFEEARDSAQQARDLGELVHPRTASQWFGIQLAALHRDRGELEELDRLLDEFVRRQPWVASWRCARILSRLLSGDRETGAREFEAIAAQNFADLRRDATWLAAATYLAEICSLLDDAPRAGHLYSLLRPHAGRAVSIGPGVICLGSAARYLGLLASTLGRFDAAEAFFEEALKQNTAMGARPSLARTQFDYARMRLQRGAGSGSDHTRARELAAEALVTANEVGMPGLAQTIQSFNLTLETGASD